MLKKAKLTMLQTILLSVVLAFFILPVKGGSLPTNEYGTAIPSLYLIVVPIFPVVCKKIIRKINGNS